VQQPSFDFYEGLNQRKNDAIPEAIAHYEKALNSGNASMSAAAAAELMSLHFSGAELSPATMSRIRQKADGSWAAALEVTDSQGKIANREKALALLLNGEYRLPDESARYVLHQWRDESGSGALTDAESAAINGRLAVSRSRYNEAIIFFRITIQDSPELFFRHPDLIGDLGRSFQYTATGTEGINLLVDWEKNFAEMAEAVPEYNESLVRHRLLFFAARIARQRGIPNIELFEKALLLIPADETQSEQTDACIWYILDSSLARGTDTLIRYVETYASAWNDDSYFLDVMDKLARELVLQRQWEKVLYVYSLLKNRSGVVTAKYAWLIGKAIEAGLFSPRGGVADSLPEEAAKSFIRIAYNANGALYYHVLSAELLGEPFLYPADKSQADVLPSLDGKSDSLLFLQGFFENDASGFALSYIRAAEASLPPEELYFLARALGEAGLHQESMQLVSRYIGRGAYQAQRHDLELLYPRPFRELVEQYAEETGIDPAVLFALIRTESAFNSAVVSRAGAIGLTQLMPATAEETTARIRRMGGPDYALEAIDDEFPGAYLRNPAVNIHIGASYLAHLNGRMGDQLLALLAYNGGMSRIRRWHRNASLPPELFLETIEFPETRNYGRSVTAAAAMYRELYY